MPATPLFSTVMLIDDNPIDCFIHHRLLQLHQISEKTLVYHNCLSALDYLNECQHTLHQLPELILLDLHLPIINGLEFLVAFGRLSGLVQAHCRIVILSCTIKQDKLLRQIPQGQVWGILEKPLRVEVLEKIAQTSIQLHPAGQEQAVIDNPWSRLPGR